MLLETIEALGAETLDVALDAVTQVRQIDPDDRDTFGDFDGIRALCQATIRHGEHAQVLYAFSKSSAFICKKSNLNRGVFRSEGGIRILLQFLAQADNAEHVAACADALHGVCLMNDGNKKTAALLQGEFNEEDLVETECLDMNVPLFKIPQELGALDLLLKRIEEYPDEYSVQESCVWALRVLACDDDPRQASCAPSAVENRDYLADEDHFPRIRALVRRHMKSELVHTKLFEGMMLLLKEVGCHQNRIHSLVLEDDVLPRIKEALQDGSEHLVKASLFVIRQFAFSDDMKDLLTNQDVHLMAFSAVKRFTTSAIIVEQAFGLFSNLTMRKPAIAQILFDEPCCIMTVSQVILGVHKDRPQVLKTVLSTLRNIAKQVEDCETNVRDNDIFELMRKIVLSQQGVVAHRDDAFDLVDHCQTLDTQNPNVKQWQTVVDICKQFLREFREDDAIRTKAKFNEFY